MAHYCLVAIARAAQRRILVDSNTLGQYPSLTTREQRDHLRHLWQGCHWIRMACEERMLGMQTSRTARCWPHLLKRTPLWVCFGPALCMQLCDRRSHTESLKLKSAIVRTSRPVVDHRARVSPTCYRFVKTSGNHAFTGVGTRRNSPAGPPSILQVHLGSLMSHTCTTAREYKAQRTCWPVGDHSMCFTPSIHENIWYIMRVSESLMMHLASTADATNFPSGEKTGVGPVYWYASEKSITAAGGRGRGGNRLKYVQAPPGFSPSTFTGAIERRSGARNPDLGLEIIGASRAQYQTSLKT